MRNSTGDELAGLLLGSSLLRARRRRLKLDRQGLADCGID